MSIRFGLPVASLAMWILMARPASAEPAQARVSAPGEAAPRQWYGRQTLATDGAGVGLLVFAAQARSDPGVSIGIAAGVTTLVLGAPIVHWMHGRTGTGFLSLGLRLALPAMGGYLLEMAPCLGGGECGLNLLLGLGLVTAPVAVDAALLAYEPMPAEATVSASPTLLWRLFPIVGKNRRRGVMATVTGSF